MYSDTENQKVPTKQTKSKTEAGPPSKPLRSLKKAKNKQKISDSDLSLLYVQAQMKKMPVLLLTTGELTKKAQDLLKTEFKTITVKKI